MAETREQQAFTERQVAWLRSQCECETLDGQGMCIACGIAITIQRMSDDSRLMQDMTGAWVWAKEIAPSSKASTQDAADWWRQVAQGLAAEYHKLKQSWPRCEWRAYPGGPQCEKQAGHGLPHYTISDGSMGTSMGKPYSGPHIHHHYKPSVDDPNVCGLCGDGPWGIHRVQVTFESCPICIEATRQRRANANGQEPRPGTAAAPARPVAAASPCQGCGGRGVVGAYEQIDFGVWTGSLVTDQPCPDCGGNGRLQVDHE